jgi:flagellar export protein FliJ
MTAFRLDVVLRLRRLAEDAARARLAIRLAEHRDAARAAERLAADLEGERDLLLTLQASAPTAGELREGHDSVEQAERSMETGQDRLAQAGRALLDARASLATATSQREVVERLRERARVAARRATERRAELELAEFATVRHAWAEIEEALR